MPSQIKPRSLSAFLVAGMLPFCLFASSVQAQATPANEPDSQVVQVLTLVAQAEHIDRKCDAFTHEGQYFYREMKSRLLDTFNKPLFESISRAQAPFFDGGCKKLAANPKANQVVDYINGEGARMLAMHVFLAPNSPCTDGNLRQVRIRAEKAWSQLSNSHDPRVQPAAMQREADLIAAQCAFPQKAKRVQSHLAAFLASEVAPAYSKPESYRGMMTMSGANPESNLAVNAYRDPARELIKGGILAGEYDDVAGRRLGVLRDGRMVLMSLEDNGTQEIQGFVLKAGGKTYTPIAARSADPHYPLVFVLDKKASEEILSMTGQSSFTVSEIDASGASNFWEESYEYTGRKKTDRGVSVRPIPFDVTAFKAAVTYSNAPKFR